MPTPSISLNDFIGNNSFTGEFVVGMKYISSVNFTTGLGFSRLSTYGRFDSPLGKIDNGFKIRDERISDIGDDQDTIE